MHRLMFQTVSDSEQTKQRKIMEEQTSWYSICEWDSLAAFNFHFSITSELVKYNYEVCLDAGADSVSSLEQD